jgi:hypothetical protein
VSEAALTRDHHGLVIAVPVHREPSRRWIAVVAGGLAIAAVPQPIELRAIAAVWLVLVAFAARDKRRSNLALTHDTLALETTRFGSAHVVRAPWDEVQFETSPEPPWVLTVSLAGEVHRLAWSGSRSGLSEAVGALEAAQRAFDPEAGRVAPPPASLEQLREG